MSTIIDLTGQRFGRLVVVELAGRDRFSRTTWRCRCDCGVHKILRSNSLRTGHIVSCGCLHDEKAAINCIVRQTTHGHANKKKRTRTYYTWGAMVARCCNANDKDYADYGGRGITICPAWRTSFATFLADMGERPPRTTIDRIDVNGNYEPGNCRWATATVQANNTRRALLNAAGP